MSIDWSKWYEIVLNVVAVVILIYLLVVLFRRVRDRMYEVNLSANQLLGLVIDDPTDVFDLAIPPKSPKDLYAAIVAQNTGLAVYDFLVIDGLQYSFADQGSSNVSQTMANGAKVIAFAHEAKDKTTMPATSSAKVSVLVVQPSVKRYSRGADKLVEIDTSTMRGIVYTDESLKLSIGLVRARSGSPLYENGTAIGKQMQQLRENAYLVLVGDNDKDAASNSNNDAAYRGFVDAAKKELSSSSSLSGEPIFRRIDDQRIVVATRDGTRPIVDYRPYGLIMDTIPHTKAIRDHAFTVKIQHKVQLKI